ncbi:Cytochrome P450 71A1 [Apostasia shenzhenica]|uniref:Cytochrome P450 71A1 n=1 Tax=Apostasia shenzhenica TaxID=1088818 RepID=A0A2I0BFJ3_9ASPA|nr:Cytochrome P450 71A1 [Apostasia shenzhenica]
MALHLISFLSHSWLLLLPLIFLLFSFFSFFLGFRGRRSHTWRLPPGPPPLPIIGSLHELSRIIHVSFHRLAKKYGPLIYLKLGNTSVVIVSSMEVASEILKTQDIVFCSRPPLAAITRFTYDGIDIGASPFGEYWKKMKRFGNVHFFNTLKVLSFRNIREEEVDVLINDIRKASFYGEPINFSERAVCLLQNITFRQVFSKRVSVDGECRLSPYHDLIRDMMSMMASFNVRDFFPSFWWLDYLTGWKFKLDRRFQEMDRIYEKEIRSRLKSPPPATSSHNDDFLDALLHRQIEIDPSLGFMLSRKEVKALLMDMFFGGTDTSSVTIEWGMTELMRNPKVMIKAQQEVRRVAGDKEKVEGSDTQHLQYLKMVIMETLRLHPPTTLLAPRECMKDTRVNGYDIPAKTIVVINVWSMGRNSKYWDDPHSFRPERFENKSINYKGNHFNFIPFGSGRRICPGIALSIANVELALANILYNFDWKLPNGTKEEDIDMREHFGLVTRKKTPLVLFATPKPTSI